MPTEVRSRNNVPLREVRPARLMLGAVFGAVAGILINLSFAQQGVGVTGGAFGTAVVVACISAIATLLYTAITAPSGETHGAGIGPGAGHAISAFLVYITIILPVSLVVGAAIGWFRRRQ